MTLEAPKKLIDVVSTSTADYSHANKIAEQLKDSQHFASRLLLSGDHGHTVDTENGVFSLPVLGLKNSVPKKCIAMAQEIQQFTDFWTARKPDCCVLIGDRFELLPIASVAIIFDIPLARFFGGECDTSTCFDNDVRDAITKLAHLHYVSHWAMKNRLYQMGEENWRICVSGNPAVNRVSSDANRFIAFAKEKGWGHGPFISATYLPPTRNLNEIEHDLPLILAALARLDTHTVIWTGSNVDPGSERITEILMQSIKVISNIFLSPNLGSTLYQDLLAASSLIIGNSSSAILEAATFGLPAINIGSRQVGRLHSNNLLNCTGSTFSDTLDFALRPDFIESAKCVDNPFFKASGLENFCNHLHFHLADKSRLMMKNRDVRYPKNQSGLSRIPLPTPVRTTPTVD